MVQAYAPRYGAKLLDQILMSLNQLELRGLQHRPFEPQTTGEVQMGLV